MSQSRIRKIIRGARTSNETQDQGPLARASLARSENGLMISNVNTGRVAARSIAWLGGGVPWLATMSPHFVTKLHHAAFIGLDLRQIESDFSVELLEELYPIANQDRQDRITNFVG